MAAINLIIHQIDGFIRKYYKNLVLKGVIWCIGIFCATLLFFGGLEYFGWFSSTVRAILFYTWLFSFLFVFGKLIVYPVLQLFRIAKGLDYLEAARIIGNHFPEVGDKLLNTLQLSDSSSDSGGSLDLIQAAIEQRSKSFKLVEFTTAVDEKKTLAFLKYVIPCILFLGGIILFKPALIVDSSKRIINYNMMFEKPAPFQFVVEQFRGDYVEGENIKFRLTLVGDAIPDRVFIQSSKGKELLSKERDGSNSVDLGKAVVNGFFYFEAGEYNSKSYTISVKNRPSLIQFSADVSFPSCFDKKSESFLNVSDLVVPEGSYIQWKGLTKNCSLVDFYLNDSLVSYKSKSFSRSFKAFSNQRGVVLLKDDNNFVFDSLIFQIQVVKDEYPLILVDEFIDSMGLYKRYFKGKVSDDNGLKSLKFNYTITNTEGKRSNSIEVKKVSGLESSFEFAVDFLREKIASDDVVEYYFSVTDNDCVHGGKTSFSNKTKLIVPSKEELIQNREEMQNKMQTNLSAMQQDIFSFQDQLNKLKRDINSSKSLDWKLQNQTKQLFNDYNQLMEDAKNVQKELEENAKELDKLSKEDKSLLEKQELLNELLKQLMDDEMKALLDKLQSMVQDNKKQDVNKTLEDLKKSSEDMNRNLDRSIENLKRMQVDEKIDNLENQLKSLAEEQRSLEEQIQKKKDADSRDVQKQKELNQKFDDVKDKLKELSEDNQNLKRPFTLPDLEGKANETSDDLNNAFEKLEKSNKKESSKSQKSAADKMEEMAKQLDAAQNKSKEEQQGEDIDLLRQILKSLVSLSHSQEYLIDAFYKVKSSDPYFKNLSKKQSNLVDDFKPVSDSLYKLAERQAKIAKFVDDEIKNINSNHVLALDDIQERRISALNMHQQYAMTSFNNLSLMLNEALQQMQSDMQSMKDGDGSCDKPGSKGKPKPGSGDSLSKMKEQLKKQLEQMEKGSNPGDKDGKEKGGEGENGSLGLGAREIAKMAAEQSLIRKQLEELKGQLKEGSKGANGLSEAIKDLEKQEEDIVNRRFNQQMINRQKNIVTRMLESEKALEEREWSEERESKEGKDVNPSNLILINEYNKEKLKQIEEIQIIDPRYQKYYKERSNEFLNH